MGGSSAKHKEASSCASLPPVLVSGVPPFWLCWWELRSPVQLASWPPEGPWRGVASRGAQGACGALAWGLCLPCGIFSAHRLALPGPSWSLVNEGCSFQGLRRAPTGLPSVVSQRKGENPRTVLGRPGAGLIRKPSARVIQAARPPELVKSLPPALPALCFTCLPILL